MKIQLALTTITMILINLVSIMLTMIIYSSNDVNGEQNVFPTIFVSHRLAVALENPRAIPKDQGILAR